MKRILSFLLGLTILLCATSCESVGDGSFSLFGCSVKKYQRFSTVVLEFDDFFGRYAIDLERSAQGEGTIHYAIKLFEGSVTVSYDSGLLWKEEKLVSVSAEDGFIRSSGGYIERGVKLIVKASGRVRGRVLLSYTKPSGLCAFTHAWNEGYEIVVSGKPKTTYRCAYCAESVSFEQDRIADGKTYRISVDGYWADSLPFLPKEAESGTLVEIRTERIADGWMSVSSDDVEIMRDGSGSGDYRWYFIMPCHDVAITVD